LPSGRQPGNRLDRNGLPQSEPWVRQGFAPSRLEVKVRDGSLGGLAAGAGTPCQAARESAILPYWDCVYVESQ
jgi:hypothetical protein